MDWKKHSTAKSSQGVEYTIWYNGEVYQATTGEPPTSDSGYYRLDSLLKLKGLTPA